jgi:hypothetical protein
MEPLSQSLAQSNELTGSPLADVVNRAPLDTLTLSSKRSSEPSGDNYWTRDYNSPSTRNHVVSCRLREAPRSQGGAIRLLICSGHPRPRREASGPLR